MHTNYSANHLYLAYIDTTSTTVFTHDLYGQIIHEVRGRNDKSPNMTVTVLDSDDGKTIAEVFERGEDAVIRRYRNRQDVWHEFTEWYAKKP